MSIGYKKYLFVCLFAFNIILVGAQNFFSEQEENLIYYSPDIAPTAVCTGDIDKDGDLDILSFFNKKFRLYEHSDAKGNFIEQEIISSEDDWILSVCMSDLNNDGKEDILAASYNNDKIVWYQNEGGLVFGSQLVITDAAKGAISVHATDLDGDGDQDVLSASLWDNKIAWYENDGSGIFSGQKVISTMAEGARYVYVSDLNSDGLPDVVSASIYDNKIAWYKNEGAGSFGDQQIITDITARALCIYSGDLDGDGSQDLLSASSWDNKIAWYKNDGTGNFGTQQVISDELKRTQYVHAADLDNDGDLDVLSASLLDDKIAWYENDGTGVFGMQHIVTNSGDMPGFVYASDINGDGYLDIVSASTDFKIAWYENTLPMKMMVNPKDTAVYPTKNAGFSIIAEAAANYQWQCNNGAEFYDLNNDEVYAGVHTNTLEITGAGFDMNGYSYRCMAINGSDSLSSKLAVLTINDTVNPVITSVHPDTILSANINCFGEVPDFTGIVVASDNSDAVLDITQNPLPWSKVYGNTEEITLTATDYAGNSSQVTFSVLLIDNSPPVIKLSSGTLDLVKNDNGQFVLPDFKDSLDVSDNCSDLSMIEITQEPAPNYVVPDSIYDLQVRFTAKDAMGNSSELLVNAIGMDRMPPQITSIHNDIEIDGNFCFAYLPEFRNQVEATDNVDLSSDLTIVQTPPAKTLISGSTNKVTISVTDKSGNTAEVTFNVGIKDNKAPLIKCLSDQIVNVSAGQTSYTAKGTEFDLVSVEDDCEIRISNNINDSSTLDQVVFPMDTTELVWTVIDESGNKSQCSFIVIVTESTGRETNELSGISIYPNPAAGELFYESARAIQQLRVITLSGKILIDISDVGQEGKISLSELVSGMYILSIRTDNKVFKMQIIKE